MVVITNSQIVPHSIIMIYYYYSVYHDTILI